MIDCAAVKSPLGILKILITLILVPIVLIAAFGNEGFRLTFGTQDFIGVGASAGLVVVVPLLLITYIGGGSVLIMEALLSLAGGSALIGVGVVTVDAYGHPQLGSPAGKALGGLCLAAGALFALNLLFVFKAARDR